LKASFATQKLGWSLGLGFSFFLLKKNKINKYINKKIKITDSGKEMTRFAEMFGLPEYIKP
jgi:hypothetical protein